MTMKRWLENYIKILKAKAGASPLGLLAKMEVELFEYASALLNSKSLMQVAEEGSKELGPAWLGLLEDLYHALFSYGPVEVPEGDEHEGPEKGLMRRLLAQALEDPEFKKLKLFTSGSVFSSALATEKVARALLKALRDHKVGMGLSELQQLASEVDRLKAELEYLSRLASQAPSPGIEERAQQLRQELSQRLEELKALARALGQRLESDGFKADLSKGIKEAREEVSHLQDRITQWGMEPGQLARRPIAKQMELLDRLQASQAFQRLADLVGKLRQVAASKVWKTEVPGPGGIKGVEFGRDLLSLHPVEALAMDDPVLEQELMVRWHEGRVLVYRRRATEHTARGAIVCCIDQSGSMQGQKSDWASALAVGLAEVAIAKKRPFFGIIFSSDSDPLYTIEVDPYDPDPARLLDLAETVIYGGTSFEKPLRRAVEVIESDHRYRNADIVFITDGEAPVSEPFRVWIVSKKEELRIHIYSIVVDVGTSTDSSLRPISDEILLVTRLNEAVADRIYEKVAADDDKSLTF